MAKSKWRAVYNEPHTDRNDLEVPASTFGGDWILEGEHEDEYWKQEQPDKDIYEGYNLDGIEIAVLDATVVAGLSIREAAEILRTSPSTVYRIKRNALEKLRKELDQ